MIARAHLGRLERHVSHAGQTPDRNMDVLGLHYVAALADAGDGLRGTQRGGPAQDGGRGHRVRVAEAATRVRGDGELDTVLDRDLARVAHFMAAGTIPRLLAGHHNGTDAQGEDAQQMHRGWGWQEFIVAS